MYKFKDLQKRIDVKYDVHLLPTSHFTNTIFVSLGTSPGAAWGNHVCMSLASMLAARRNSSHLELT